MRGAREMAKTDFNQKQFQKMTTYPVRPLIMKLAAPTVVSMLVTGIYNTADTYFVSQLGTSQSAAVSVVFSLMALIQAVGFTLGMGSGSIISRSLGAQDRDTASKTFSTGFISSLVVGCVMTVLGLIFIEPIMNVLGSTETALPYAKEYARYILFGAPIMMGTYVLNNLWRWEGKAFFSMIGIGLGGVLNIFLDPFFISFLDMGVAGAAIATLISQIISFILLLVPVILKKNISELKLSNFSKNPAIHANIWITGLPSLLRQGLASISSIFLNQQGRAISGDAALSAMGIYSKVTMLIFCILLGIGQGFQPVIGFNSGAKKYDRMKTAFTFTWIFGSAVMLVFAVPLFFFAEDLMPFFIDDQEVIAIGARALRLEAFILPLLTVNVMCNMTFQSIGERFKASFLSCLRQGLFFIPLVFILPSLFGIRGLEALYPVCDLLSCLLSVPFAIQFLVKLNKMLRNSKQEDSEEAPEQV
ncbi:MAG: MATE family efflux transporter [Clostridiales bacterium]|nr:MATE family efflux transporter [Candidatus Scatonaster coprocaballi]